MASPGTRYYKILFEYNMDMGGRAQIYFTWNIMVNNEYKNLEFKNYNFSMLHIPPFTCTGVETPLDK